MSDAHKLSQALAMVLGGTDDEFSMHSALERLSSEVCAIRLAFDRGGADWIDSMQESLCSIESRLTVLAAVAKGELTYVEADEAPAK